MPLSARCRYRPVLVKTITLRLPEASYNNLVLLCQKHNVTMRGIFEATTIICCRDLEDPLRREWTLLLWDAARALDESEELRRPPRRRVNAKLDDEVASMLAAACVKFGVSQNAALGLVTTKPWPIAEPPVGFRSENWARIVELARVREFARRPYALT